MSEIPPGLHNGAECSLWLWPLQCERHSEKSYLYLCVCEVFSVCVSRVIEGSFAVWLAALRLSVILFKGKAQQKSYDLDPSHHQGGGEGSQRGSHTQLHTNIHLPITRTLFEYKHKLARGQCPSQGAAINTVTAFQAPAGVRSILGARVRDR